MVRGELTRRICDVDEILHLWYSGLPDVACLIPSMKCWSWFSYMICNCQSGYRDFMVICSGRIFRLTDLQGVKYDAVSAVSASNNPD